MGETSGSPGFCTSRSIVPATPRPQGMTNGKAGRVNLTGDHCTGCAMSHAIDVETYYFADDGVVPNSPLPLVVYRGALAPEGDRAAACERMFAAHGWPDAWRNGIYGHHHYHSTAHEVLGIARGEARVRLGGESGESVELREGDVVVIPAGVAHKRESASPDLLVIGSYPRGQNPDMCRAEPARYDHAKHDRAAAAVAAVTLPASDAARIRPGHRRRRAAAGVLEPAMNQGPRQ